MWRPIPFVWWFWMGSAAVLGQKKVVLGHKMRGFGRAPPDLAPPPWGDSGEFLAQMDPYNHK